MRNKLTLSILLALVLAMPLAAQKRQVSVDVRDVSVKELLRQVEAETGFTFAYNNSEIDLERNVTVSAVREDVVSVMNRALKTQNLVSEVDGSHIVISRQKNVSDQELDYGGVVYDVNGAPLIGAGVIRSGSTGGGYCNRS